MAAVVELLDSLREQMIALYEGYVWCYTFADKRTEHWPFMSSVKPTLFLTLGYFACVWIGPRLMENRKPFDLRWPLVFYNLGMVCLNLYIALELAIVSRRLGYNYYCQPVNYSYDPDEMRVAHALWWFYFSKFLEYTDTIFFILRKRTRQLTFLHVYHHSTMFFLWWIGVKWVAGGWAFLGAMVNSFIHVIMYAYYGLSAIGPSIQKYLWWKRYLTIIQLAQFMTGLVLGVNALRIKCNFPTWMQYALVIYMCTYLVLFGDFYKRTYCAKTKLLAKNIFAASYESLCLSDYNQNKKSESCGKRKNSTEPLENGVAIANGKTIAGKKYTNGFWKDSLRPRPNVPGLEDNATKSEGNTRSIH